jgi:hypothetical protein
MQKNDGTNRIRRTCEFNENFFYHWISLSFSLDRLQLFRIDWSSLSDEDFSHLDSIVNLKNQQKPPTKSKESHQSFSSSENLGYDARENRTK